MALIAADTKFFRDFVLDPYPEDFRTSAILALMPYLSAFAHESANYIERTDPAVARVLQPNKDMLFWSRTRLKLTEDKYKTPTEVLENVEELIGINSGWFLEDHRGIRRPLRLIQPDVGLTFMNNEMIYTTHVAFLNLGLTKEALSDWSLTLDNLGPFLHDRSVNIGRYVKRLADITVTAFAISLRPSHVASYYYDLPRFHHYHDLLGQHRPVEPMPRRVEMPEIIWAPLDRPGPAWGAGMDS